MSDSAIMAMDRGRPGRIAGETPAVRSPESQWEDQERVDLLAVKDHEALDEAERGLRHGDAVEIAAGGEELAVAIVHDAHGKKIRPRLGDPVHHPVDAGRTDEVAVAVRLE